MSTDPPTDALAMQHPVPGEKAAQLLELSMRNAMTSTISLFENQMRLDHRDSVVGK